MEYRSFYTEQMTLDEGDVDFRGLMKPSALLRCAEHLATAHAWELGMDKAFYSARHMVYLVGRQAFQFYKVPAMRDTLTLTTYPEQSRRAANKRVMVVCNGSGEEIARVDTRWTLVDTDSSKIIRHIPEDMEGHWNEEVAWELSQTVPKAPELIPAGVRRAGYSICDTNRHINNIWTWSVTLCPRRSLSRVPCSMQSSNTTARSPLERKWNCFTARQRGNRARAGM